VVTTRKKGCAVARDLASDPISLIAAEIHRGYWPAGINGGWLEYPYSKHVPVQHDQKIIIYSMHWCFCSALNGFVFMPFQKA
jgi:hypothetical protein